MSSVLDPVIHKRLIAEIDEIARTAGIPKRFIESSMIGVCGKAEVEWVRKYRDHATAGRYGLCFVEQDHATQMMAMCGALTRNFVFSQLIQLHTLIEMLRINEPITASVLFVPSFHRTLKQGAGVTPFQINLLWSLLEDRMLQEKQTVIAVQSIAQVRTDYGPHFGDLIQNHYEVV